ncbi:hypothetical protein DL771_004376 [Monosporascus sp. 5C6A]|nr:hypothetical protein DL771_004376 [Monosporascus sp. 5C6A]
MHGLVKNFRYVPSHEMLQSGTEPAISPGCASPITSRCSVKLSAEEIDSSANALRIYPVKTQVNEYNHQHTLGPNSPAIQVTQPMRGAVYDISWAEGANVLKDPPEIVMVALDSYTGPALYRPMGENFATGQEFASGLSYLTVSGVRTPDGLMFEAPFDRSRIYRDVPVRSMQLKLVIYEARKLQALDAQAEDHSDDFDAYTSSE